jgi:uncharacterized protein (TIGR00251 family)
MIEVVDHAEGCILPVRAQPGARRDGVVGAHNGALKVAVRAPADQGKANAALAAVLCEFLALKKSQVELLSGHAARDKRFLIRVAATTVRERLARG